MQKLLNNYPRLSYFILTTVVIAIIGMLLSKLGHGSYDIGVNIAGSIAGGLFVLWQRRHKTPVVAYPSSR